MIHYISGRAGSGKTHAVREAIREAVANGRECVVLVPEQQTVLWETKLASCLPPSANLRLEITNFTRLANSVFRTYGGLADDVVDDAARTLLVWRAMGSVWEQLRVYNSAGARGGREDRNVPHLMRAIDDFKNSGITPAMGQAAVEALEAEMANGESVEAGAAAGDLLSRLRDAVTVYAAYEAILHEEAIDRGDLIKHLADALERHPYFEKKAVFVDSFFSLTHREERIFGSILRQSDDVTVTFTMGETGDAVRFKETREFFKTACRLAAEAGREVHHTHLTDNRRHKNAPALAATEESLFRHGGEIGTVDFVKVRTNSGENPTENDKTVRILTCADLTDESEATAAIIQSLLHEGFRCRDIAVVARDMKSRDGILDSTLRRHGIPCFLAETGKISSSPAVRLVLAALQVEAGGWQRRDVVRLVKTGMTPLDRDDPTRGDLFENYLATWNLRGKRMFTADGWALNPDGYKTEITDRGRAILAEVNAARDAVIPPLARFGSLFEGEEPTVRDIACGIVGLGEDYAIDEGEEALASAYRAIGMPAEGDRAACGWRYVCEILDKMVRILGDTTLDAARFAGLFRRAAEAMDRGSIPTAVDEVILGSASGVRFEEVRCVILLGATEGEFPASSGDGGGFFGDSDRVVLESVGLNLRLPDGGIRGARELFMFYRSATAASERLWVLCPTGDGGQLSVGAEQIRRITGVTPARFAEMPLEEAVFDTETARYLLARRTDPAERKILADLLREAEGDRATDAIPLTGEGDRIHPAELGLYGGRMSLSQTRIESFVRCPFHYTCRYLLRLREEPKAEIRTPDIGTFIHHVLERFFTELTEEMRARLPLSPEETEEMAEAIVADYMKSLAQSSVGSGRLTDGRLGYLFLRLRRYVPRFLHAIMKEMAQSQFRSVAYELPIGLGDDGVKPMEFVTDDGTVVTLRGIADRVDLYDGENGRYVRIVDYKTGAKEFSLDNVKRGLDVQLLLYLFSLWKFGLPKSVGKGAGENEQNLLPAGAVYFSVRPAMVNAEGSITEEEARARVEESIARSGVYLNEETVLRAMDADLDGRYVSVKENKAGTLTGGKATTLLTLEDFGLLAAEMETVIGKIAGEMKAGRADATPDKHAPVSPCAYCPHRRICKNPESVSR